MSLQERTVVGTEHGLSVTGTLVMLDMPSTAVGGTTQCVAATRTAVSQFVCPVHVLYTNVCWPLKV